MIGPFYFRNLIQFTTLKILSDWKANGVNGNNVLKVVQMSTQASALLLFERELYIYFKSRKYKFTGSIVVQEIFSGLKGVIELNFS